MLALQGHLMLILQGHLLLLMLQGHLLLLCLGHVDVVRGEGGEEVVLLLASRCSCRSDGSPKKQTGRMGDRQP